MKYKYNLMMKFRTGDFLSDVRNIENEVNTRMVEFGFDEKIFLETEFPLFTVNSDNPLTTEEKKSLMQTINDNFSKKEINMVCISIMIWIP